MKLSKFKLIAQGDEVVMDYIEKLKKINENSEFQSLMSQEESAKMMINTYIDEARDEAKAEVKKKLKIS